MPTIVHCLPKYILTCSISTTHYAAHLRHIMLHNGFSHNSMQNASSIMCVSRLNTQSHWQAHSHIQVHSHTQECARSYIAIIAIPAFLHSRIYITCICIYTYTYTYTDVLLISSLSMTANQQDINADY